MVDNFGDIGVTWRLARQLQREGHGTRSGSGWTIWPASPASAPGWIPHKKPSGSRASISSAGTTPRRRCRAGERGDRGLCLRPARPFIARMAEQSPPPAGSTWSISAEAWVEDCHGLASPAGWQPEPRQVLLLPGFHTENRRPQCERGSSPSGMPGSRMTRGLPPTGPASACHPNEKAS